MSDSQQQEKPADAWGQPISEERQAELQGYLDEWAAETYHGVRRGPFDRWDPSDLERERLRLTGADVSWLADQSGREQYGLVPNLHLEGATLSNAHLEGATVEGARLEGADLGNAYLETLYVNPRR